MSNNSRQYTAWDNSNREDFYSPSGKLETTHVDRYKWDGSYSHTDVYNAHNEKINSFVK